MVVVRQLAAMLGDSDHRVRSHAAWALGRWAHVKRCATITWVLLLVVAVVLVAVVVLLVLLLVLLALAVLAVVVGVLVLVLVLLLLAGRRWPLCMPSPGRLGERAAAAVPELAHSLRADARKDVRARAVGALG